MLLTLVLMIAAPQSCTEVKQQCRACTSINGKERCSNIGIACQPSVRICRRKDAMPSQNHPMDAKQKGRMPLADNVSRQL